MISRFSSIGGSSFGSGGRYLVRSGLFLLILAALTGLFLPSLKAAFEQNPYLNGAILGLMVLGIGYALQSLWDVLRDCRAANRAAGLMEDVRKGAKTIKQVNEVLLTPARNMVAPFLVTVHRIIRNGDTSSTLPYLLDSLSTRAEDRRAWVRYLIGTLILLGLIGTFYGLLVTIDGVRGVIGGLAAEPGADTIALFSLLKARLDAPLDGMGLAFSSSLFGLLASLILAFIELQLLHAQNDFQTRLETLVVSELLPLWQPALRMSAYGNAPQTPQLAHPTYLAALLETTAERLDRATEIMQSASGRDAEASGRWSELLSAVGERIEALRTTLETVERDRTASLREEFRLLTRVLSHRDGGDAEKD